MGIKEIEQAISQLSREELAHFRKWYLGFDAEAWDQQIEADASAGKFDQLAEKAIEDYQVGKFKEL